MERLLMRITEVILAVALLGAYLVGCATADGNDSNAYTLKPEAKEELISFVNEARDFVLEEGQDKALEVFNDPKGTFVRGELYIIAYDFNGTRLAHPYELEMIGKNALNVTDPNGVAHVRNMRELAKRGGGFSYYIWTNPAHSGAEELKLDYVLKVDEGLWLGAGIYLTGPAPIFSKEAREDLAAFVEGARDFDLNNTKDAALKAFNDRNGEFVSGNRYIFAYDFEGNTLALPFEPEMLGSNRLELRDPNDAYSVQAVLDVAKRGSGYVYAIAQDPAENMTSKLKLYYVTKVDDEWFLGSGIYWTEI
jgi:polar amino acid transport system substrate-binding protein